MKIYIRRLFILAIVVVICTSLGIGTFLQFSAYPSDVIELSVVPQSDTDFDITRNESETVTTAGRNLRYDVIISSYMNSGSRFTGRLFGFRRDAFYLYEPLWRFNLWGYYHGDSMTCSSTTGICRNGTVRDTKILKSKFNVDPGRPGLETTKDLLLKVLSETYSCHLQDIGNVIQSNVHDHVEYSGPSWDTYRKCVHNMHPKVACLKDLEEVCRNANHRVTKVLRMTVDDMESLLKQRPNLKIIHLLRDPRAIINSRIETMGYPVKAKNELSKNALNLCRKMRWDVEGGKTLSRLFPGRFKFIFYEDLKEDVHKHIKQLYEFLGMTYDKAEVTSLNFVKPNNAQTRSNTMRSARISDNAKWWRNQMKIANVQIVQQQCKEVFKLLNLLTFANERELKNSTLRYRMPDPLFDEDV